MEKLAISEKYTLTVAEACEYFGIGDKKMRKFIAEHTGEDYILMNGTKVLIKRKKFENIIDTLSSI